MVVVTRVPVPPAPPASRTVSSQPLARAAKSNVATQNPNANASESSAPRENGGSQESPTRSSPAPQTSRTNLSAATHPNRPSETKLLRRVAISRRPRKVKRNGLFSSVALLTLIFLSFYTVFVCPTERGPQDFMCRSASNYRRVVIEPIFVRPIRQALAHPSVAPYVAKIEPHINKVVQIAKPVVFRARAKWNARVRSQWNRRALPWWNKYVSPRINRAEVVLRPYYVYSLRLYSLHVAPRAKSAGDRLRRWQHNSQPYIILAASKCHESYQALKPYTDPIWRRIEAGFLRVYAVVEARRRLFVDPHVTRIWEKVKELSNGKPEAPVPPSTSSQSTSSLDVQSSVGSLESTHAESTVPTSTEPKQDGAELPPPSSSINMSPDVVSVTESTADNSSPSNVSAHSSTDDSDTPFSRAAEEPLSSASSVASDSTHAIEPSASSTGTSLEVVSTSVPGTVSTPTDETVPSEAINTSLPKEDDNVEDDADLQAFLADLGLDDSPEPQPSKIVESAPPRVSESEEEKAQRLLQHQEKVALERADIMRRHSNWETRLETLIKTRRKELRKALVAIRKAAVAELKEPSQIKNQVDSFLAEAEKYLKGVEMSFVSLKRENKRNEDKLLLWLRVVKKVEEKFTLKTRETETAVNEWYAGIVAKEMFEVQSASSSVKALAEEAQANIGMDYAWLDDVTYQDWQRYHNLMKRSNDFNKQVLSIQNGEHPSPPINPTIPGLENLRTELQDIITGFDTRLRRIKRDGEVEFKPASEVGTESGDARAAQVSILPVPDKDQVAEETVENLSHIVLGRSKEEVAQALRNAESYEAQATPSHDSEGDQVVESMSPEGIAVDNTNSAPVLDVNHDEL